MAAAAILFLMDSSQKLIRSSEMPREQQYQIWMQSKQRFFLMAATAILFLMDSSQKLIRSSEIPREQPYQIWMQSNQRLISYAHKLFRRPSLKMAAYGVVPLAWCKKNIWDELPRHIGHVCKK